VGRPPAAILTLLCLAAVAAPSVARTAGGGEFTHGRISDLRVCPYELFDRRLDVCTRDARERRVTSSRFACSARILVRKAATLRGRWLHNGRVLRELGPLRLARGTYRHSISWRLRRTAPLPGGAWRCELELGDVAAGATFASGGGRGGIVNLAVCDAARAERVGPFLACRSDESKEALVQPAGVVCNAVAVSPPGSKARIELLSGNESESATTLDLESAMDDVSAHFRASTVFRRPTVPPGRYACRYSIVPAEGGSAAVVDAPFRVAA